MHASYTRPLIRIRTCDLLKIRFVRVIYYLIRNTLVFFIDFSHLELITPTKIVRY
ncbi:hypothetical protein XccvBFoX7_gp78c [Xanthomonas phage FoX7]|uniref:Uncharacterized protein n=2 Tax=Carpasinavirus XcP1 TaxID=2182344 RepID=A0A858NR23_9CAUD|nr:hypothetical protein XccvBFoX6_gp78c [Xanthomonas phage FoX6]QJB22235.1 hypothetical protein XccvBFoX7_gp78c [Xanthomonas phage FoX7]